MRSLVLAGLVVTVVGCAPREHLSENYGLAMRRIMSVQTESQPQRPLASLSAQDAKIILANQRTQMTIKGATQVIDSGSFSAGGGGGMAGAGLLTPLSGNLFGGGGASEQ